MSSICRSISSLEDVTKIDRLEDTYNINFPKQFKEFFAENNGGIPLKKEIEVNGVEYEVRCFLSFMDDEYNSIKRPLEMFQKATKGKIAPFAKDSSDNYYCINLDNGKIYYWEKEEDSYYAIADNFVDFIMYFK